MANKMKKSICLIGASFLVSASTLSAHHCDNTPDDASAKLFVQDYYQSLIRGVNRNQLSVYLSKEQNVLIDSTIMTLASQQGNDLNLEAQRLMDSFGVQAACESVTNLESQVWGMFSSFAKVSHVITPTCTTWTNNQARSFNLRFSDSLCDWVITDISQQIRYP